MRLLVSVVSALALTTGAHVAAPEPAGASPPASVTYTPPVDAPVVDPFRAPPNPYSAGNRGVDYATQPGTPVRAAAPGQVVFAGPIGFTRHVVVLHPDGLRTSYSFLRSISVRAGQPVERGDVVGTAGDALHFGVRAGDAYLDPMALFGGAPRVHLVPDVFRQPLPEAAERAGLGRSLIGLVGGALSTTWDAVQWAAGTAGDLTGRAATYLRDEIVENLRAYEQEIRTWIDMALNLSPVGHLASVVRIAGEAWRVSNAICTPDDLPQPRIDPRKPHIAVLVAGIGSHTNGDRREAGDVANVDVVGLGYQPGAVHQFSYRGGTTMENGYRAKDTFRDINASGKDLAELLERISKANPGVPIDIIAHSQGGIVARTAVAYHLGKHLEKAPTVTNLVTLGSPHTGSDLATLGFMIGRSKYGDKALDLASKGAKAGFVPIDPNSPAAQQLAEHSEFMRKLNNTRLPKRLRVTSIAASTDLVVTSARTRVDGARNVIVDLPGTNPLTDHGNLPGSAEAEREIALAINGLEPGCQNFASYFFNRLVGDEISRAIDGTGGLGTIGLISRGGRPAPVPDMTHTTVKEKS